MPRSIPMTLLILVWLLSANPRDPKHRARPQGGFVTLMYGGRAGRARGRMAVSCATPTRLHQAVVSSFAAAEPEVISPGGAFATTTMAGRSSLPFNVQTGVHACITLPGAWAALSCSAIA